MAGNKKFYLRVVTPSKELINKEVDFISMRTKEGEIGILADHAPLTTVLATGVIKIDNGTEELFAAIFDGFAEIKGNSVTILSDNAEWPDEIDPDRAQKAKERAEKRLKDSHTEVDIHRAEAALRRAMVRLDVYAYKPRK